MQAFSQSLGNLLGQLREADGAVDSQKLARSLVELNSRARALEKRGTELPELLRARIGMHLDQLEIDDLLAIRTSLHGDGIAATLGKLGGGEVYDASLVVGRLNSMVTDRLNTRLLDEARSIAAHRLQEVADAAADGVSGRDFHVRFRNVTKGEISKIIGTLDDQKLLPEAGDASADIRQVLVKEAMGALSQPDLRNLLQKVRTEELKSLSAAESSFPGTDIVNDFIGAEVTRRRDELAANVTTALAAAVNDGELAPGITEETSRFADAVVDVATSWKEYVHHCSTHAQPVDRQLEGSLNQLVSAVERDVDPDSLALGELDIDKLYSFQNSLQELGIRKPEAALAREINRRIADARTGVNEIVSSLAEGMKSNDFGKVLGDVVHLKSKGDELAMLSGMLGQKVDDADKRMGFRMETFGEVVRAFDTSDLRAFYDGLVTPEVDNLIVQLGWVGNDLIEIDEARGRMMVDAGMLLNDLLDLASAALEERGVSLPEMAGNAEVGREHLTPEARQAIRDTFQVDIPPREEFPPIIISARSPEMESYAEAEISRDPSDEEMKLYNGQLGTINVLTAFGRDLPRDDYTINGEYKRDLPESDYPTDDHKILWAAEKLAEIAQTPEQLRRASLYASQAGTSVFATQIFNPERTPLTLSDGTRVATISGNEASTHYDVRRDRDGNLVVRIDYLSRPPHGLVVAGNGMSNDVRPVEFDRDRSHVQFGLEVLVTPDGQARLCSPVAYDYDLKIVPNQ